MTAFDRLGPRRKLSDAERYQGKLSTSCKLYLQARGIDDKIAGKYLLGTCDDVYPGRLSIPYLRPSGVVGMKFRSVAEDETPKYLNQGPTHLYNTAALGEADRTGEAYITEGEIDAITATDLYGLPAVGVPGATQWTGHKHWSELFRGYDVVHVLADPDDAGSALAAAIMDSLPQARIVRLPYDVNDMYTRDIDLRGLL